jgi:hypothetical protein
VTTPIQAEARALVEEVGKHEKMPDIYRCQSGCGPWPCDTSRLADALSASLAEVERLEILLGAATNVLDTYIDPAKGLPHDRVFLLGQRAEASLKREQGLRAALEKIATWKPSDRHVIGLFERIAREALVSTGAPDGE